MSEVFANRLVQCIGLYFCRAYRGKIRCAVSSYLDIFYFLANTLVDSSIRSGPNQLHVSASVFWYSRRFFVIAMQ